MELNFLREIGRRLHILIIFSRYEAAGAGHGQHPEADEAFVPAQLPELRVEPHRFHEDQQARIQCGGRRPR